MSWLRKIFSKPPAPSPKTPKPASGGPAQTGKPSGPESLMTAEVVELQARCMQGEIWMLGQRHDGMVTSLCCTTADRKLLLLFTSAEKADAYTRAADVGANRQAIRLAGDKFQRCLQSVAADGIEVALIDRDPATHAYAGMLMVRQTLATGVPVMGVKDTRPTYQAMGEEIYAVLHFARTIAAWLLNRTDASESQRNEACGKLCGLTALASQFVEASNAGLDKEAIVGRLKRMEAHAMGMLIGNDGLTPRDHYAAIMRLLVEISEPPPAGIGRPVRSPEAILEDWGKGRKADS